MVARASSVNANLSPVAQLHRESDVFADLQRVAIEEASRSDNRVWA